MPPTKTQRHLDLLAYLIARRFPVAVDELMEKIPAYAEKWVGGSDTDRDSVRRTFERDKADLLELGIPLDAVRYESQKGEVLEGYQLTKRDFYLPYLRVLEQQRGSLTPSGFGMTALAPARPATLDISEDLASRAHDALARVRDLPAFPFAREAESGLRKLRFDTGMKFGNADPVLYAERPGADDVVPVLRELGDALKARKRVRFRYHGMYRGTPTERDVALYGLLFQGGNWYAIGHDALRDAVRVFRVSRMEDVKPNTKAPKTPDYEMPTDFDAHAYLDRDAWELGGEGDAPLRARVLFRFPSSLLAERNEQGELVEVRDDGSTVREFAVHQVNPFLRWVLTFAGEAEIVEPSELANELRKLADTVAGRHSNVG